MTTRIGVVGAGWRAEYFLRIARELPERFEVANVLVRSQSSAERVSSAWGLPATTSVEDFLTGGPYDFVVLSVPREESPALLLRFASAGVPVLAETPPAGDLAASVELYGKVAGAPIQVAEQYRFQPQHAARLAVGRSGVLGDVHTATVSVAHDYHGVSLIRAALGAGFSPVRIAAHAARDRLLGVRGRDGWVEAPTEHVGERISATLDFGDDLLGEYEFSGDQYVSPLRARRLVLRGPRGELRDDTVDAVTAPGVVATRSLHRVATGADGDLEGSFLRRILLGADVLFENPVPGARLNDDEIAVAELMIRMSTYVAGGDPVYPLADGLHDHYLGLLIAQSATTGAAVESAPQPWSSTPSVLTR